VLRRPLRGRNEKARAVRLARVGLGSAWLALIGTAQAQVNLPFGEAARQRDAAGAWAPAPLQLPAPAERNKNPVTVSLRFYADDDYRAGLFRWAERARTQLGYLNQIVEPAFGIRFEAESFRRWHRESSGSDVNKMLAELEKMDPGIGVDWVVAYVTPLPLISTSMHEIGAARLLGRHFLMRGMASADESSMLNQSFDKLSTAEREQLYGVRKWHKECAIFLHEWLHTLGAIHSSDPQRIMNPSYSTKMSNLDVIDAELAEVALRIRLASRHSETTDWSPLRVRLAKATSAEWLPREKAELLALLGSTGARSGSPSPAAEPASSGESEAFRKAVALFKEGKSDEAWAALAPEGARLPENFEVHRLLCRLSFVPAARKPAGAEAGLAACARARQLGPDRPEPLVDEAQARLQRREPKEALASVESAAALAGKLPGGQEQVWTWIARVYGSLGALERADQALDHAAGKPGEPEARELIGQERRGYGLPRGALPPGRELAYAERHRRCAELVDAGRVREARAALDQAHREFPDVPGLDVLSCELELRQGRSGSAEKLCGKALARMNDLPRAHYLMAHIHLKANARQAAIDELKTSLDLDPRERGTWETLAELYRAAGKRQELAALKAEYSKRFSRPLR
jgi:predicted Zn-dependent protease